MKEFAYMKRLSVVLVIGSFACAQSVNGTGNQGWTKENVAAGEVVLCEHQVNGEQFFVAKAGDRLKVGTLLDMTEYPGEHVFRIGWNFRNEKDDPITAEIPPTITKQGYLDVANKLLAETIGYQTIAIGESKSVRASVEVRKCAGRGCDTKAGGGREGRAYEVEICTVKALTFLRQ